MVRVTRADCPSSSRPPDQRGGTRGRSIRPIFGAVHRKGEEVSPRNPVQPTTGAAQGSDTPMCLEVCGSKVGATHVSSASLRVRPGTGPLARRSDRRPDLKRQCWRPRAGVRNGRAVGRGSFHSARLFWAAMAHSTASVTLSKTARRFFGHRHADVARPGEARQSDQLTAGPAESADTCARTWNCAGCPALVLGALASIGEDPPYGWPVRRTPRSARKPVSCNRMARHYQRILMLLPLPSGAPGIQGS